MVKTTKESLPQHSGEISAAEANRMVDLATRTTNLVNTGDYAERALRFIRGATQEFTDRARSLFQRWRTTYYMLSGNTLDRAGPMDVHVPELYKAIETLVPRLEEAVLEKDPWFRVIPRRSKDHLRASALSAFLDWQFDQAKIRDLVQPMIRDMLVTQVGVLHVEWESRVRKRYSNEIKQEWDEEAKDYKREVITTEKEVVEFYGPKAKLIDPFNFIVDTKSTNVQDAAYVGHRVFMEMDEIVALGQKFGWANLDAVRELGSGAGGVSEYEASHYSWPRSPTSLRGQDEDRYDLSTGRPRKLEVTIMYGRFMSDGGDYKDYRVVAVNGHTILDVRENPLFSGLRPYAVARSSNNGHEFFGVGVFDNAVRLNQHLDRHHSILLRASEVSACPLVFAEDGSDLPDSLYKVRPFTVLKGAGQVNFSSVPNSSLQSAPMILGMLQRNIEETVGAFRIQMGQGDISGSTATESTLALQEGNRRTRGLVRALSMGFEQLLNVFHSMNQQYSLDDVEFPVMGKRGVELRAAHTTVGPEDFLQEVQFTFAGMASLHTYGLRATGYQTLLNGLGPLIAQNPHAVDQLKIIHDTAVELIGPDEADAIVNMPTPRDQILPQTTENEILISGTKVPVAPEDDDVEHLKDIKPLYDLALDESSKLGRRAREAILEHAMGHIMAHEKKQAQKKAEAAEQERKAAAQGLEAGANGEQSTPAGGFDPNVSGGSERGQTNGPPNAEQYQRTGRENSPVSQSNNQSQR